jgi:hypothetical protein
MLDNILEVQAEDVIFDHGRFYKYIEKILVNVGLSLEEADDFLLRKKSSERFQIDKVQFRRVLFKEINNMLAEEA